MSLVTKAIGCAKKIKHRFSDRARQNRPVYLCPVRRIERVALNERVAAMTFDDGPCALPANPSDNGKPLTLNLIETLEKYGARGTFDAVGDTSQNYPDKPGKEGSVFWGGIKFDHYPDFGKDSFGGVKNCPELVKRILDGGHEITSHTWAHVLFGPKPLVYGRRDPLNKTEQVISDLTEMHSFMKDNYGYDIKLSRPPHYVDNTKDGFSAYDAYAVMGYQYLAASFDGAGWLPLSSYEAEVEATWKPIEQKLMQDPDYFCGQIIFQKDGYNMARRSPVVHGLEKQLELLTEYGYRIVTVSELLKMCPFADLSPGDENFGHAKKLLDMGLCICYRDNTVRQQNLLTRGELAMMLNGSKTAYKRIELVRARKNPASDVSSRHPYAAAIACAVESSEMTLTMGRFVPNIPVTPAEFASACKKHFGCDITAPTAPVSRAAAIRALSNAL